jgi:hypothetical protein
MHGQKKRRKRTIEGAFTLDGTLLNWALTSEPQWSNSGDGYKGLCVSVQVPDHSHRELIIEYPYPRDKRGKHLPVPQRPPISSTTIETSVRQALSAGWDPNSRGKAFVFLAPN